MKAEYMLKSDWDKELRSLRFSKIPHGVRNTEYKLKILNMSFKVFSIKDLNSLDTQEYKRCGIHLEFYERYSSRGREKESSLADYFESSDLSISLKAIALYILKSVTLYKIYTGTNIEKSDAIAVVRENAIRILNQEEIKIDTSPNEIDIELIFEEELENKNDISNKYSTHERAQLSVQTKPTKPATAKKIYQKNIIDTNKDLKPFAGLM